MVLNFNDVCRLCARKCEDMQNIFQDTSAESESFMDVTKDMSGMLPCKIAAATSIKVRLSLLKKVTNFTSMALPPSTSAIEVCRDLR
jgi:hypothetical protein